MTDTQELRRLHGAATQGEWRVAGKKTIRCDDGWIGDTNWRNGPPNAAAIVALHNAAPALFDAADRLARVEAVLPQVMVALQPFGDLAEGAKAAFPNDRVTAGNVCRSSVSFTDFERARAAIAALVAMMGEG